jgi:ribosomal protein S4E
MSKLSIAEIEDLIRESFKGQSIIELKSVQYVNHRPHSYMIGRKHIAYASEHSDGMLGIETLKKVKCAVPGCNLSYDKHTSEIVAFLTLLRNADNLEIDVIVKKLVDDIPEGIFDGIMFVETSENFRITQAQTTNFEIKSLEKAYNKAVKEDKVAFDYKGVELVTDYAKYLIEHLKNQNQ